MNTSTLPVGKPFPSVAALRRQHSALLRDQLGRNLPLEEILNYLGRAKATGRILASDEARDAVQSVLDYWATLALSKDPKLANELGSLFPDEFAGATLESAEASPKESSARKSAEISRRAEEFSKGLSEKELKSLRVLLLRLVRYSGGTRKFYLQSISASDLSAADQERVLLDKMLEEKIVHKEGEESSPSFVLADEALLTDWPLLRDICVERKAFHDLSHGWFRGGKQSGSLLEEGRQLSGAADYSDLSDWEREFLETSRETSQNNRSRRLKALSFWVVVTSILALVALGGLLFSLRKSNQLERQREELEKLVEKLQAARNAEAQAREETKAVTQSYEKSQYDVQEVKQQALSEVERLRQALPANSAAQNLANQIGQTVNEIPVNPNLSQTAKDPANPGGWQAGKVRILDVDNDSRIKPTDTLALIRRWSEADALRPPVFKTGIARGPEPLLVQLDSNALFIAARWDYKVTPRRWLVANKIKVRNPRTEKTVLVQPVDWGPSAKEGHLFDISPGLAKALGLKQDDVAEILVPPPAAMPTPATY